MKKVALVVFIILLIDQVTKIYVKTHMAIGESFNVAGLDWFQIHFVENPGAAYGFHLGGYTGKLILSALRIFLIILIAWWINKNIKTGASNFYIYPMAMILAGAAGNLIDGIFYSVMFDQGTILGANGEWEVPQQYVGKVAKLDWSGYNKPFLGCVVDMFHFPFGNFPEWVPIVGGKEFFSYVFNVADSAITLGVTFLLLFRKKAFKGIE